MTLHTAVMFGGVGRRVEWRLLHGDCLEVLRTLPETSVDACVTDPPYGIGFMGKEWDTFDKAKAAERLERSTAQREKNRQFYEDNPNPNLRRRQRSPALSASAIEYDYSLTGLRGFQKWCEEWGAEVLRVLKPGGYAVVCGAPRAYHRMACGLENAGFEIRDCLAWLFGSGFPKSLNLGEGLGTALKPAHEPIVLARKPFKGTVKANIETFGTGALNIDAARIPCEPFTFSRGATALGRMNDDGWQPKEQSGDNHPLGRWPANVVIDDLAALVLDEQSGELGVSAGGEPESGEQNRYGIYGSRNRERTGRPVGFGDVGGASRFYYVAKPSREERDYGCSGLAKRTAGECTDRSEGSAGLNNPRAGAGRTGGHKNFHPTVKPVELMRWLVKLVTPINGTVLDPFTGSGTTGMACRYEQRSFIGIEREAEYIEIARRRIDAVAPLFSQAEAE